MQIGYIGLGKMGHNMVERLIEKGHEVFVFDTNEEARNVAEKVGAKKHETLEELIGNLESPRTIWVMVPHDVLDSVLEKITPLLSEGDMIIDGGNSLYKESIRHGKELREKNIRFMDVGTSGGPGGARSGACMMIGGERKYFDEYENLFRDLTVEERYGYMGKNGAGHFVKMIHNGIEYGMMQAIAEGFEIMKESPFDLNLREISRVYNHGSVVESRLTGWLESGFKKEGEELANISSTVGHTGEGAWTVDAAKELGVPAPVIEGSLEFRKQSQENPSYTGKILSLLRNQFGGHSTQDKK